MEKIQNHHPYLPLDCEKDEIRLLELLPYRHRADRPVQGRLIQVSLREPPQYDALSYMWGDTEQQTLIELDETVDFAITANLGKALSTLRQQSEYVYLWVDAICINQHDVPERNAQVRRMWQIFAKAQIVRVWLDIDIGWDLLRGLRFWRRSNLYEGASPDAWLPVLHITNHDYWRRVWVQQEVEYASQILINCRNVTVDHGLLVRFFKAVVPWFYEHEARMREAHASDWKSIVYSHFVHFAKSKSDDIANARRFHGLYDALLAGAGLDATDERDRVYGMLSLMQQDYQEVEVDYRKDVADVFRDVAALLLRKYESLTFLSLAGVQHSASALAVPTWVPQPGRSDTPLRQHHKSFMELQARIARIPKHEHLCSKISADGRVLQVHGFRLGSVIDICKHVVRLADPDKFSPFNEWNPFLRRCSAHVANKAEFPDLERSLFRVLFLTPGQASEGENLEDNYQHFHLITERPFIGFGSERDRQWTQLRHTLAINTFNSWIVVLQDGTIGLAPQ